MEWNSTCICVQDSIDLRVNRLVILYPSSGFIAILIHYRAITTLNYDRGQAVVINFSVDMVQNFEFGGLFFRSSFLAKRQHLPTLWVRHPWRAWTRWLLILYSKFVDPLVRLNYLNAWDLIYWTRTSLPVTSKTDFMIFVWSIAQLDFHLCVVFLMNTLMGDASSPKNWFLFVNWNLSKAG